jgi:ABC-type Co2+ transport system permease subunit
MNEFFVALAAGFAGYLLARRFVSRRLRFVDAVQSRFAPLFAAVIGALAILPLTALPLVTFTTAMIFGIGAGLGTASGARLLRRADTELRRLLP